MSRRGDNTFTPASPPRLIAGRSAAFWSLRSAVYMLSNFGPMFGIFLSSMVPTPWKGILAGLAVVLIVGLTAKAIQANYRSSSASRREREAGYTTLSGSEYRHLWLLNPKTGAVIRPPDRTS